MSKCVYMRMKDYHLVGCKRAATMEHEGKAYCHQHHPPSVEARNELRSTAWREKWQAEADVRKRERESVRLCQRFTLDELERAVAVDLITQAAAVPSDTHKGDE